MVTYTVDGEHFLPYTDVGLSDGNQLVTTGIEHAIISLCTDKREQKEQKNC